MEENKTAQTEVVGEKQLEDVAGGTILDDTNCWFLPQEPVESNFKVENNKVLVKCRSTCSSGIFYCNCRGKNDRCIDKWHFIERAMGDIWLPSPQNYGSHSKGDKSIRGLKI